VLDSRALGATRGERLQGPETDGGAWRTTPPQTNDCDQITPVVARRQEAREQVVGDTLSSVTPVGDTVGDTRRFPQSNRVRIAARTDFWRRDSETVNTAALIVGDRSGCRSKQRVAAA